MTKNERQVIRNILERLRNHKGATDAAKTQLSYPEVREWIESFVITPLEILQEETVGGPRQFKLGVATGVSK